MHIAEPSRNPPTSARRETAMSFDETKSACFSAAGLATTVGGTTNLLAQDAVLKVGVVHQGPISDTGWEFFHARATRAMEAAFPGKVKATVLDNVLQAQDAERIFRQLA